MGTRLTSEILYLRHDFTQEERLEMGAKLAENYNNLAAIAEEEKVMKGQIKERMSGVEASIGSLSRSLGSGFSMENVRCSIKWDFPNVGEVTYVDPSGKEVKSRPMTEQERQLDLPLSSEDKVVAVSPEKSADNIVEFFNKDAHPLPDEPVDALEGDPDDEDEEDEQDGEDEEQESTGDGPEPIDEEDNLLDPKHDAEFAAVEAPKKRGRGRPPKTLQGFSKPTNSTGISDF